MIHHECSNVVMTRTKYDYSDYYVPLLQKYLNRSLVHDIIKCLGVYIHIYIPRPIITLSCSLVRASNDDRFLSSMPRKKKKCMYVCMCVRVIQGSSQRGGGEGGKPPYSEAKGKSSLMWSEKHNYALISKPPPLYLFFLGRNPAK